MKRKSQLTKRHSRIAAATVAGIVSLASTSAFAATTAYANQINALNPLVYYQFDETSGSSAANSGTGGATYTGTISTMAGAVTLGQSSFAQGGTSYDFGGGAVLSANALTSSLSEWTMEAWVNYDSAKTTASNFLGNDQSGWNDDVLFGIGAENGNIPAGTVGLVHQGDPGKVRETVSSAINAGQWYHIVMTGSETDGELNLFVDGTLVSTNSVLANGATFNGADGIRTANLTVGAAGPDGYVGRRAYDGLLDEVAIYGSVLSDSQIASNAALGISPIPEPSSTALLGLGGLALTLRRRR